VNSTLLKTFIHHEDQEDGRYFGWQNEGKDLVRAIYFYITHFGGGVIQRVARGGCKLSCIDVERSGDYRVY